MCGIAGFSNFNGNYTEDPSSRYAILQNMNHCQKHRGPDEDDVLLTRFCGLAHVRLSILDPSNGHQPMTRQLENHCAAIVYNGEIYNMPALRSALEKKGIAFETTSDTEVILMGYLRYGIDYVKQLNGIFAFCIWDESLKKLYLFRDRMGVKPLFYTLFHGTLIFSSELKGILAYPGFQAQVDREGLCEIFGLGPAKTYGKGVFKDVCELLPGHFLEFCGSNLTILPYWTLESRP